MPRESSKSLSVALERIDVLDFLEELGLRNVEDKGTEIFYSCPFPGHNHEDRNPSASMSTDGSTKAYCFSCGWRGNALRFLADYEGVSPLVAARWIRQRFGDDFLEPEGTVLQEIDSILNAETTEPSKPEIILDEEEVRRRTVDWVKVSEQHFLDQPEPFFYMLNRGFDPKILIDYEIGWDHISQRITIPYRNEHGQFVGFKARAFDPKEQPRYKTLGGVEYGFKTFPIGNYLWGLDSAPKNDHVFVVEGELNALSMRQRGYRATVGISGKRLTDQQVGLIKWYFARATFIFDELDDGRTAASRLAAYGPTYIVRGHDKDPADMTDEELSELVSNKQSLLLSGLPSD